MIVNEYLDKKLRVLNMLIASAKSRSARGVSHQPAFKSSRLTISHTLYLPYLPSTRGVLTQKQLKKLEPKVSEVICSEFTTSNKKWICFSFYRPPTQNNLECFFNEVTTSLSQTSVMYDNLIVMGDFNIDVNLPNHEHDKISLICQI